MKLKRLQKRYFATPVCKNIVLKNVTRKWILRKKLNVDKLGLLKLLWDSFICRIVVVVVFCLIYLFIYLFILRRNNQCRCNCCMHTWQIDEPYISNRPFAGLDHVTILKQKIMAYYYSSKNASGGKSTRKLARRPILRRLTHKTKIL